MSKKYGTKILAATGALAATLSLTGCGSHSTANPTTSTTFKFALAQNALEEKFIEIADASCKFGMANGFTINALDGQAIYLPASDVSDLSDLTMSTAVGKNTSFYQAFQEWGVPICEPTNLEQQVPLMKPGMLTTEHRLMQLDAKTWAWYSHHGSSQFNGTDFTVEAGRIVSFVFRGELYIVKYGPLTAAQTEAVKNAQ